MLPDSKKKSIFLDIDGTLIMGEKGPFTEDLDAMREAAGRGHSVFLNTGRSLANISRALLELPFIRGAAAGGGAHVLLKGSENDLRTVYHKWVSEEMIARVFAWYSARPQSCVLEGEQNCYIINGPYSLFTIGNLRATDSLEEFKNQSRGDFITKLTLNRLDSEDERRFLETFFQVNCFPNYAEGIIKGENKAKAMGIILKETGLERENSIAIGDSGNDLDMLRFAGMGIAMGNATPELKEAAAAVTSDCGKGGVAVALRKFVLSE